MEHFDMEVNILDLIKVILLVLAALFTYFRFFREGTHKQRIEFNIELTDLGIIDKFRLVEIVIIVENKGSVSKKFKELNLTIRGIDPSRPLSELENHEPKISFPNRIHMFNLVSREVQYYFVRPKVIQKFPAVLKVPSNFSHLLVQGKFLYSSGILFPSDGEFHQAERAFNLIKNESGSSISE